MTELRQRQPRETDPAFLAFLRRMPCETCPAYPPSEAAHLRGACRAMGKRETGKGERPSDCWALPLCPDCHRNGPHSLHQTSEAQFFEDAGFDPFQRATELYAEFCRTRPPRTKTPNVKKRALKRGRKNYRQLPKRPFPKGRGFTTRARP